MTELKTLKDLIDYTPTSGDPVFGKLDVEELRAEAVKWIKSDRVKNMNAMDFILVFFDLEAEDLKEVGE